MPSRWFWFLLGFFTTACVLGSHFIFQKWLYMPPCENCVYIRYFFLCISFGAFLAFLQPRILGIFGFIFTFYGCIFGILTAVNLNKIHAALQSGNLFGVTGCKLKPNFHFSLPLDEWFAPFFKPLALCGHDAPVVPAGVKLSTMQEFFVTLYAKGWYLIPEYNFLNLAQCSMLIFSLILVVVTCRILWWLMWR